MMCWHLDDKTMAAKSLLWYLKPRQQVTMSCFDDNSLLIQFSPEVDWAQPIISRAAKKSKHQTTIKTFHPAFRASQSLLTQLLRESWAAFLNGPTPASSQFIIVFSQYSRENLKKVAGRIRTQIVRVEGEDVGFYTTTTALEWLDYVVKYSILLHAEIIIAIIERLKDPRSLHLPKNIDI